MFLNTSKNLDCLVLCQSNLVIVEASFRGSGIEHMEQSHQANVEFGNLFVEIDHPSVRHESLPGAFFTSAITWSELEIVALQRPRNTVENFHSTPFSVNLRGESEPGG